MDETSIPMIIYGTAWKEEQTTELVESSLIKGCAFDTANQPKHYQEGLLGEFSKKPFLKD